MWTEWRRGEDGRGEGSRLPGALVWSGTSHPPAGERGTVFVTHVGSDGVNTEHPEAALPQEAPAQLPGEGAVRTEGPWEAMPGARLWPEGPRSGRVILYRLERTGPCRTW